jgi:hypothetical protein
MTDQWAKVLFDLDSPIGMALVVKPYGPHPSLDQNGEVSVS